jgi:crotonobetaine/carnitine-CoA ligase
LEQVWTFDDDPHGAYPIAPPATGGDRLPLRRVEPGELSSILYTSGTTGPSKGVCSPAAHVYRWAVNCNDAFGIEAGEVFFNAMPLYHINALSSVLQAMHAGGSCVIADRFSASRYWEQAAAADATFTNLLGVMVNMLLAQPPRPSDRAHGIRRIFAPDMPVAAWPTFAERFGIRSNTRAYGSTETNCICSAREDAEHPAPVDGYAGHARAGYEARVVDENDVSLPPNTPGELVVRSTIPFGLSSGYYGMPDATVEAWRNLWFHTGDLALRLEDGGYRFLGRMKEAIRRRGENISVWEVEQAIRSHEAVDDVAVFGVASELGEEEVMAAIVLRRDHALAPEALMVHLVPRLARFAIPRYIDVVEQLPTTENGKVRRLALRDHGVTRTAWDREAVGYALPA